MEHTNNPTHNFRWMRFNEQLTIVERRYPNAPNNQLALELVDEDGLHFGMATSAVMDYVPPSPRHALIKNYSENTTLLDELVLKGIVEPTGVRIPTGYVHLDEVIVREA